MEGIRLATNDEEEVAVAIELESYGGLWEDF